MIIELNIGLHVAGSRNGPLAVLARTIEAKRYLRENFGNVAFNGYTAEYQAPDGPRCEPGLFASFDVEVGTDTRALIYQLAERLGQDCIAIFMPGAAEPWGCLIGPKAVEWGEFDLALFKRFDPRGWGVE